MDDELVLEAAAAKGTEPSRISPVMSILTLPLPLPLTAVPSSYFLTRSIRFGRFLLLVEFVVDTSMVDCCCVSFSGGKRFTLPLLAFRLRPSAFHWPRFDDTVQI